MRTDEGWREVIRRLGLAPDGWVAGTVSYRTRRDRFRLTLSVGAMVPQRPVRIALRSEDKDEGWVFVPRDALWAAPSRRTGDGGFDEAVGIVHGSEDALLRLGPEAREVLRVAIGHRAWVSSCEAGLEPEATAAAGSVEAVLAAVDAMADALRAVALPSTAALVERYARPDAAKEVERVTASHLERAMWGLSGELRTRTLRVLWERSADRAALVARLPHGLDLFGQLCELSPDDPVLVDLVERLWRIGSLGSADVGRWLSGLDLGRDRGRVPTGMLAALLGWLENGSPQLRCDAARGLGRLGAEAAIEPLARLADGWLTPADLRSAARQALDDIRSRPAVGAVSLADPGSGGLSIGGGPEEE